MKIDAIFGGLLALVVLAIAIFAVANTNFGAGSGTTEPASDPLNTGGVVIATAEDIECQCFSQGFDLAGKDVGVMSSQYRTGFEQCRVRRRLVGRRVDGWLERPPVGETIRRLMPHLAQKPRRLITACRRFVGLKD
mgnify:CR=1 FL=1